MLKQLKGKIIILSLLAFTCSSPSIFSLNATENNSIITINLQNAYPKRLKHLGTLPLQLAELVKKMSAGKIIIKVHEPGVLIESLNLESAVDKGKIDAAFSGLGYVVHKHPAIELFTSLPFGPSPLIYAGWMYYGGGLKLLNQYFADSNIIVIPSILLPPEASGWFKKQITSPDDLKGLKIRAYGLARPVLKNLGAKPVMLPAHKLYNAFKSGEIDAAEFSSPSIDSKLRLYEVAKYYYFPGWHQPATFLFIYFNKKTWNKIPYQYRVIIQTACRYLVFSNYIQIEAAQKEAIENLSKKTIINNWSPEMLKTFYTAWKQVIENYSKEDPKFHQIWQSIQQYQKKHQYWKHLNSSLDQTSYTN
jgi:TRAP-type mannitol/chloroaromatic compound transport system substrate-binding protein